MNVESSYVSEVMGVFPNSKPYILEPWKDQHDAVLLWVGNFQRNNSIGQDPEKYWEKRLGIYNTMQKVNQYYYILLYLIKVYKYNMIFYYKILNFSIK